MELPTNTVNTTSDITWVTCLFDIRSRENKTVDNNMGVKMSSDYLIYGEFTMALDVPLIIYIDQKYEEYCIEKRKDKMDKTLIIPMDFEDLPYYVKMNYITEIYNKETFRKDKFTPLYTVLTWSKFSLLERSIKENHFNSKNFGWVDFGLIHVYVKSILHTNTVDVSSIQVFKDLAIEYNETFNKTYNKCHIMKMGPCKVSGDAGYVFNVNYYNSLLVHLAGGMFSGPKNIMSIIINLFKRYAQNSIKENKYALEEKILSHIHMDIPELFDLYYGDYYEIISNSLKFTKNLRYLTYHLIHFRKLGYTDKIISICEPIFNMFKNNHFNNEDQTYCSKFFDEYYLAWFYKNKNKAFEIAKFYADRITTNEKFKKAFEENEPHIRKNFSYLSEDVF